MEMEKAREQAPFNLALNTLERISSLIEAFSLTTIRAAHGEISPEAAIIIKFHITQQLFLQSVPLFSQEAEDALKKELDALKLPSPINEKNGGKRIPYDEKLDTQLYEMIIKIQNKLQEENGCFMGRKSDPGTSWIPK